MPVCTTTSKRAASALVRVAAALGWLTLAVACDEDPRDAYFGTDAGADYRLPPLLDARSDGTPDQADAGEVGDGPVAPGQDAGIDLGDAGAADRVDVAEVADTLNLDRPVQPEIADVAPGDVTTDLGGDAGNDATSG